MINHLKRAGVATLAACALALPAAPHATAAPAMSSAVSVGSLSSQNDIEAAFRGIEAGARDAAWNVRNQLHAVAYTLPDNGTRQAVKDAIDATANALFPGIVAERTPAPAPAPAPTIEVPENAAPANPVAGSPCPPSARVCVDLAGDRTWLQRDGKVEYGPVTMSHGAPSPNTETPKGTFPVNRKVRHEVSREFNNAPMPYAIYFTYNGHAFHQGTYVPSHGCIRMAQQDAAHYFDNVNLGDQVFIY